MTPFSVLLSIYHKEQASFLHEAMSSIWTKQLLQPTEIILVQDGPLTPELNEAIAEWQHIIGSSFITIQLPENVGLGKALNQGLKHCQYELVARMDTDDICLPTRFHEQVTYLHVHPEVAVLGTSIQEFDKDPSKLISLKSVPTRQADIVEYAKKRSPFNHPSVMYRKSVIEALGGYQHHLFMEDYNLWLRIIAAGYQVANLEEVLLHMRAGQAMLSRRRGWVYVKSEWKMVQLKKQIGFQGYTRSIPVFFLRALPRLLPSSWLTIIYRKLRQT
ncbi:glycosyltransferase [Neisseriaceae bacterium CLB008]